MSEQSIKKQAIEAVERAVSMAWSEGWRNGHEAGQREAGTWSAPYDTLPEEIYHNGALYRLVRGDDKRPLRAARGSLTESEDGS